MSITRITFSPHTANAGYVGEVAVMVLTAQLDVATTLWGAQIRYLQAVLDAQGRFMETACQAAIRQS